MNQYNEIELSRDCEAVQIPSGHPVVLPKGINIIITQALGGTYTVATPGGLARIESKDADALGLEAQETAVCVESNANTEEKVWDRLKQVFDPEIPVNIVDLGLVYDCIVEEIQPNIYCANIRMTLTSPGCGMGPAIVADARQKILSVEGIKEANIELVWDPAWNQSMISPEGQMQLGLI